MASASDQLIGQLISHYRILQRIGQGGMGVVYKSEDTRLQRFAALKFLPPEVAHDPQMRDRFLREARAASALNHPNICTIYQVDDDNDHIFIAMEFLDGLTLREQVEQGPLPLDRLLDIATQVLDGLEAAHTEGIIHRDIKLGNIFLTKSGRAKILDFGLAKKGVAAVAMEDAEVAADDRARRERQLTSGLAALGTAAYMSPEQALGRPLDARTDLFSFGIVLYEMATGKAPFQGDSTGLLLLSIVQERPEFVRTLNPDMPEALQLIIDKCLQKQREDRYQSARDIRNDLLRLRPAVNAAPLPVPQVAQPPPPPPTAPSAAAPQAPPSTRSSASVAPGSDFAVSPDQKNPRRFWKTILSVAILALAAALAVAVFRAQHHRTLKPQDGVVLADFTNTTGESVFDNSLNQALRFDLEQSPYFQVLSARRVSDLLREMNRPPNQRLTLEVARELCLRSNSKALIQGSIASAEKGYAITLSALACQTGAPITQIDTQAKTKSDILNAMSRADRELRRKLGESLPSIQKLGRPLEESTTSSLEALEAYSQGYQAYQRNSIAQAIPSLVRAVALDPNFAQAHSLLGSVYFTSGEVTLGEEHIRLAYQLRNRVSERERFRIVLEYLRRITGQDQQAVETCQEWLRLYPDDASAYIHLGSVYLALAQFQKSAEANRQATLLAPERVAPYINGMLAYFDLERYDEAKALFAAARARGLDNELLRINRYILAFLENDNAAMQEQLRWVDGRAGSEDWLLEDWADSEAFYGRYLHSREIAGKAQAAAIRDDLPSRLIEHRARVALREAEVGNVAYSRKFAKQALAANSSVYIKVGVALAYAKIGDTSQALDLAQEVNDLKPEHALIQNYFLPSIRAAVELHNHNPEKALSILSVAQPLDFASTYLDGMQTCYLRGLAYLQLKDGAKAAAEFQKLLDHPALVDMSPTGPLAHLQIARAEVLAGNTEAARRHYQDFFALWKDADPNLLPLQQAKSEYARLP